MIIDISLIYSKILIIYSEAGNDIFKRAMIIYSQATFDTFKRVMIIIYKYIHRQVMIHYILLIYSTML